MKIDYQYRERYIKSHRRNDKEPDIHFYFKKFQIL